MNLGEPRNCGAMALFAAAAAAAAAFASIAASAAAITAAAAASASWNTLPVLTPPQDGVLTDIVDVFVDAGADIGALLGRDDDVVSEDAGCAMS